MEAIGKYLVIRPIEEEVQTESGLLLSSEDINDIRYRKGEVVSAGTDVVDVIKGGMEVVYDRAAGHTIVYGKEKLSVIREQDIVVVNS